MVSKEESVFCCYSMRLYSAGDVQRQCDATWAYLSVTKEEIRYSPEISHFYHQMTSLPTRPNHAFMS